MRESSGHITAYDGITLYYRTWEPDEPVGSVVLVHGTNEHIGRYEHVAAYFAGHGLAVYALDQRGFGKSEGTRCYVDRFEDYIRDLRQFVEMAQAHGKPVMIGHSLGGLIAFRYALAHPDTIRAVVLSSPMFGVRAKVSALEKALAPVLSALTPRLQMPAKIPPEHVTRNPAVVERYKEDPLVWKKATPRWFTECTKAALACHQGLTSGMKLPVLFLQAEDDMLVDPEATRAIYKQVPHERKTFKLYPNKYHEIFNDPGYEEVFADILHWLQQQELIPAAAAAAGEESKGG